MNCPRCGAQLNDGSAFCTSCGLQLSTPQGNNPQPQPNMPNGGYAMPQQPVNIEYTDHTQEFSPADISDNKVFAMLPHLLGSVGVIIALLASKDSPFTLFNVRQGLKITVSSLLVLIFSSLLAFTVIVPITGGVCLVVLGVIRIICFFNVCNGKAKEAPLVCKLGFLK